MANTDEPNLAYQDESLEALESSKVILTTNSAKIESIKLKHIKPLWTQVSPMMPIIQEAVDLYFNPREGKSKKAKAADKKKLQTFLSTATEALIMEYFDNIVAMIVILTDLDEDQVGELDLAEVANIVAAIVSHNLDFFTKTVLPKLAQLRLA